jgi:hypothetical protein
MAERRQWFQFIPTDVLAQQQRDEEARAWADAQRAQLAQSWAGAQRARLAGLLAERAPHPTDAPAG